MVRRQTVRNTLLTIAVILLMAFAAAMIPQSVHADDTWNVKSVEFTPASPTVNMSVIMERDNDGIYALNLANRYKKGMNNCFFKPGDKCVVTYNDNNTKEFAFSRIRGIGYAEFKASDGEIINLEALHTDNAEEMKQSGEVSVDELAAIVGTNGITIEYGVYEEIGDEIVGHCVVTHTSLTVEEDTDHDHKTAIRTRNETPAQCEATGMSRTAHYCQICGKYFADHDATTELNKTGLIIPALGHNWGDWKKTDSDQTKEERVCSRCKEKDTRIVPPEGHVHTAGIEQHWTKPKCTVSGIDFHYVCTDCDAMLVLNESGEYVQVDESALRIPADRHKRGVPEKGKETASTCASRGGYNLTYRCEKCREVLGIERVVFDLDPKAHSWSGWTVTKAATDKAAGSKERTCSLCGKTETSVIPKITVKATSISKLTAGKKSFTAKWNKAAGVSGYEIQYALNRKFSKGRKTVKAVKATTVSKKIKKLKGKKTYYVRVRSYKTVSGKTYYSKWSGIKTVKTKR